jgi:hypothetical protein
VQVWKENSNFCHSRSGVVVDHSFRPEVMKEKLVELNMDRNNSGNL